MLAHVDLPDLSATEAQLGHAEPYPLGSIACRPKVLYLALAYAGCRLCRLTVVARRQGNRSGVCGALMVRLGGSGLKML